MKALSSVVDSLGQTRTALACAVVIAAVVIVPGLGSNGFWEPQEIQIAKTAQEIAHPRMPKVPGDAPAAVRAAQLRARRAHHLRRPPLTYDAVAASIRLFGASARTARLPLALLGLAAILATFALGVRLSGPRAGLLSAFVLLGCPLFLFQCRQLMSQVGAVTGSALVVLGMVGLLWPGRRARWWAAIDVALVAAGATLGYFAAGALLGVMTPLSAVAVAGAVSLPRRPASDRATAVQDENLAQRRRDRTALVAGTVVAAVLSLLALAWVIAKTFHFRIAHPGEHAIFGYTAKPVRGYVAALGGAWRQRADLSRDFDSLLPQIGFGTFPWIAIAPVAIVWLAMGRPERRRRFSGAVPLAWAMVTWAVATFMIRKVGPVLYPALGAIAVAVGIWLDELAVVRARVDAGGTNGGDSEEGWTSLHPVLTFLAIGTLLCAAVVGKDLGEFPSKLVGIHLVGAHIRFPAGLKKAHFQYWLPAIGIAFGLAMAIGLGLWRTQETVAASHKTARVLLYQPGRGGLAATVVIGVLVAMFWAHIWTPKLSHELSSQRIFDSYYRLRAPGDELGILGSPGSGPRFYSHGKYKPLENRTQLLSFFRRPGRQFALIPRGERCPLARDATKASLPYYVLDDENAKYLLISDTLKRGEKDLNPLGRMILTKPPTGIKHPLAINYDNRVELIGVNMPQRVDLGSTFDVTFFYHVLKPIGRNWRVFVHIDAPGARISGDHKPIKGVCGTVYWPPGDYIVDKFEVKASRIGHPRGVYQVWTGFFYGHGSWTNMKVVSGEHDKDNRAHIGAITVQ